MMDLFVATFLDAAAWTIVIIICLIFAIVAYEARRRVVENFSVLLFLLIMSCFLLLYGVPVLFNEAEVIRESCAKINNK